MKERNVRDKTATIQLLEIVNIYLTFSVTKTFLNMKITQGKTLKYMMLKKVFMSKTE